MKDLLSKLWPFGKSKESVASSPATRELAGNLHFEIVPMKSIEDAIAALPPAADVSVTCSPAKGIAATQEYTERLLALKRDLGVNGIAAELNPGGLLPWAQEMRSLQILTQQVMPAFK